MSAGQVGLAALENFVRDAAMTYWHRTKADYRAALKEIESLIIAKANTREGDRLDVLTTLVEAYERTHFPMDLPDAVEAIKFRMEQSGSLTAW